MAEEEADAHNERVMAAVNAGGRMFISHTLVRGRLALRMAVGNLRTTEAHLRAAWDGLREAAAADAQVLDTQGPAAQV